MSLQINTLDFLCKKVMLNETDFDEGASESTLAGMISYTSAQATTVATSVLLSIEQVCYNKLNPNLRELNQRLTKEMKEAIANSAKQKSSKQQGRGNANQEAITKLFLRRKLDEALPENELVDIVWQLSELMEHSSDHLPVEFRLTVMQLARYVLGIGDDDNQELQVASNEGFAAYLRKLITTIGDDSEMLTLEGILGLDLVVQVIKKSKSKEMTERIFGSSQLELQKLKKIVMQSNQFGSAVNGVATLDKASTYLMQILARMNQEFRNEFTEESKSVGTGEESQKWNQILDDTVRESGTGVRARGEPNPANIQGTRQHYKR